MNDLVNLILGAVIMLIEDDSQQKDESEKNAKY